MRSPNKNIKNVSNHWKAMVLDFLTIEKSLTWKVGNVNNVRIGSDLIMGCGEHNFPSLDMIKHLHENSIYTLHQIIDTKATIVWKKGWKSTQFINFHGERIDNLLI